MIFRVEAFTGNGSGTDKDPYQVTNADELFEVRNDLSAHYIQMSDIDLAAWITEDNPSQGWNPIGDSSFPFAGSYDGQGCEIKGLKINRASTDYVGLFGYIKGGSVRNCRLRDTDISGGSYVGLIGYLKDGSLTECKLTSTKIWGKNYLALVGYMDNSKIERCELIDYTLQGTEYVASFAGWVKQSSIDDNVAVLGNISGQDNVGGCVSNCWKGEYDSRKPINENSIITNNMIYSDIVSKESASGVVGGFGPNDYYDAMVISDNIIDTRIIAKVIQGIGGNRGVERNGDWNYAYCQGTNRRNIVCGSLKAGNSVYGIFNKAFGEGKDLLNNICAVDTLSATSGELYRVSPYSKQNNYANAATVLIQNGKFITVEDGYAHGVSYGLKTLKKQSTYEGLGFDFNNHWAIVEGETLPYNIRQSKPAKVTEFLSGGKASIKGTADGTGTVYVKTVGSLYESYVVDGNWEVSLGNVKPGANAEITVITNDKAPSIVVKAKASGQSGPDVSGTAGDANGDGVVDAADVVGIINYIIGKPSASFNALNADINGDGQMLVDDAVGAVELIMKAQ